MLPRSGCFRVRARCFLPVKIEGLGSIAPLYANNVPERSHAQGTKRKRTQCPWSQGRCAGGLQIKGRLWIETQGQTYLSWGRVVRLERIGEHGSVSAAAKSMKMSFSYAWHLVEDMNTLRPATTGGKTGWRSARWRRLADRCRQTGYQGVLAAGGADAGMDRAGEVLTGRPVSGRWPTAVRSPLYQPPEGRGFASGG